MGKIKGWKKKGELIWENEREPITIILWDNNRVGRINEATSSSSVIFMGKSSKSATDYAMKYM